MRSLRQHRDWPDQHDDFEIFAYTNFDIDRGRPIPAHDFIIHQVGGKIMAEFGGRSPRFYAKGDIEVFKKVDFSCVTWILAMPSVTKTLIVYAYEITKRKGSY